MTQFVVVENKQKAFWSGAVYAIYHFYDVRAQKLLRKALNNNIVCLESSLDDNNKKRLSKQLLKNLL